MRYSAVLFDLDGTLVDSIPDLAASVNAMLQEMELPELSIEKISTFLGKGRDHLLKLSLNEASRQQNETKTLDTAVGVDVDFEKAIELFTKHYHHQLENSSSILFPGVEDGLKMFQQAGCQLAVVTNKPIEFVPQLLEQVGIEGYFEILIGGNTCTQKKPHPMPFLYACEQLNIEPHEALVIGDSGNDSIAARQAGIDVLIVPYGYNEGKSVQTLDCDGIVSTIVEAAQWATQPKH